MRGGSPLEIFPRGVRALQLWRHPLRDYSLARLKSRAVLWVWSAHDVQPRSLLNAGSPARSKPARHDLYFTLNRANAVGAPTSTCLSISKGNAPIKTT